MAPTMCLLESEDCDRMEFFKQLEKLRPEATVFLSMLNETRKQVRELRGPGRQHSAIQAYRYVFLIVLKQNNQVHPLNQS